MKNKAIISLMLIGVMVLSSTIVLANNFTSSNGNLGTNGWTITTSSNSLSGNFGSAPLFGVYSTITGTGYARAIHPLNLNVNGTHAFDLQFRFRLNNVSEGIWVGVANTTSDNPDYNQLVVGYPGYGSFETSVNGTSGTTQAMSPTTTPVNTTDYVAHVTSTDGHTIVFSITNQNTGATVAGPSTRTMPGGLAAYAVIQINNRGPTTATPGPSTTPAVSNVLFTDNGGSGTPTVSPSPSPSPSPTTNTAAALDLNAIRAFYASQPATHMSDVNAVRNADGSYSVPNGMGAASVGVSGTVTSAVDNTPIVGATVKLGSNTQVTGSNGVYRFNGVTPGKYNVTASANGYNAMTKNVDATSMNATMNFALQSTAPAATPSPSATAVAATPVATASPTKTQSPGFGIVLVAMGMILAGAFITRKKK